jgi:hypothetical protein
MSLSLRDRVNWGFAERGSDPSPFRFSGPVFLHLSRTRFEGCRFRPKKHGTERPLQNPHILLAVGFVEAARSWAGRPRVVRFRAIRAAGRSQDNAQSPVLANNLNLPQTAQNFARSGQSITIPHDPLVPQLAVAIADKHAHAAESRGAKGVPPKKGALRMARDV